MKSDDRGAQYHDPDEPGAAVGEGEGPPPRPDVRRYQDYRSFLVDFVAYLRKLDPRFSFRRFARAAGFSSPNYLKLVMDGDRNLSIESAPRFVLGLGLDKDEGDVFGCLVALDLAKHDAARNAIYASLRERTRGDDLSMLRDDQFAVYDHWWVLVVRELAERPDFEPDAEWIAARTRPKVRPAMAQKAIDVLLRTGLWAKDPATGRVVNTRHTISSGLEPTAVQGLAIRNYHRAHLELASRSLDEVQRARRNITSAVLTLDDKGYAEATEIITRARRELLEIADRRAQSEDASPQGQIHQVIFALFPVSQDPQR